MEYVCNSGIAHTYIHKKFRKSNICQTYSFVVLKTNTKFRELICFPICHLSAINCVRNKHNTSYIPLVHLHHMEFVSYQIISELSIKLTAYKHPSIMFRTLNAMLKFPTTNFLGIKHVTISLNKTDHQSEQVQPEHVHVIYI